MGKAGERRGHRKRATLTAGDKHGQQQQYAGAGRSEQHARGEKNMLVLSSTLQ
jgi:hypothetical protein